MFNTFGASVQIYCTFKSRIEPLLRATLQFPNSSVSCAGELSKPSKDFASLLVCNEKYFKFWISGFLVPRILRTQTFTNGYDKN